MFLFFDLIFLISFPSTHLTCSQFTQRGFPHLYSRIPILANMLQNLSTSWVVNFVQFTQKMLCQQKQRVSNEVFAIMGPRWVDFNQFSVVLSQLLHMLSLKRLGHSYLNSSVMNMTIHPAPS
jgi:hypothetical protein